MLECVKQSKNTFFINLRDEKQILNETNDLIFGLIKEDLVNNYKNPEKKKFTELHELMRNKMALHIFFKKNIFRKKRTKIQLDGEYVSLRVYCQKTNNIFLRELLFKYNFVKKGKKENRINNEILQR